MAKTASHPMAMGQAYFGRPSALPRVLFCAATTKFCGRHWVANTMDEYTAAVDERKRHELFCSTRNKFETAKADVRGYLEIPQQRRRR